MAEYLERETAVMRLMQDGCSAKNVQTIMALPAADVAHVRHGKWVHKGPRFRGGVDWWHCSNCGSLASGAEIKFRYCPHCGARMDEKGWTKE